MALSSKIFLRPRYPNLGKAEMKLLAGQMRRVGYSPVAGDFGLWSLISSLGVGMAWERMDWFKKPHSPMDRKGCRSFKMLEASVEMVVRSVWEIFLPWAWRWM